MEVAEKLEWKMWIAKWISDGSFKLPANTGTVAFRSKYRMARSPEDEFEFQKKTVASLKKQLFELSGAPMDKVKPIRIKLGMANSRLSKAREACGLGK